MDVLPECLRTPHMRKQIQNGHATWLLENRLMLYHDNFHGWKVQVHIQVPSTFDQTNAFTSSRKQTPPCTYSKQEVFKCQGKWWPERKPQALTQSLCVGSFWSPQQPTKGKTISSTPQANLGVFSSSFVWHTTSTTNKTQSCKVFNWSALQQCILGSDSAPVCRCLLWLSPDKPYMVDWAQGTN